MHGLILFLPHCLHIASSTCILYNASFSLFVPHLTTHLHIICFLVSFSGMDIYIYIYVSALLAFAV